MINQIGANASGNTMDKNYDGYHCMAWALLDEAAKATITGDIEAYTWLYSSGRIIAEGAGIPLEKYVVWLNEVRLSTSLPYGDVLSSHHFAN